MGSPRKPSRFSQKETSRLVRAAKAAGLHVTRITLDVDGKPIVEVGEPDRAAGGVANAPADLDQPNDVAR